MCECGCNDGKAGYFRPEIPKHITESGLVEHLKLLMPINIITEYRIDKDDQAALGVVDMVNGFCKPGCGPLAPPAPDENIEAVINQIDSLARRFSGRNRSVIVWRDCHTEGLPEPPFPPHCIEGTEQAKMVQQLAWLIRQAKRQVRKGCIDGWIGAERISKGEFLDQKEYEMNNTVLNFLFGEKIAKIVICGVCTDLCDMQLVHPLLSARNAGLLPDLKDVVVFVPGCATYDLPLSIARANNQPESAAHPRDALQHIGLYLMQQSGAILAQNILL